MDEYIGVIKMFAGNFAPQGWMLCKGQLLSVNQHSALFSILGTTYGGNGTDTFALPDLRGRVPIGIGSGSNLSTRNLGEVGGAENVTLISSQIPAHAHELVGKGQDKEVGIRVSDSTANASLASDKASNKAHALAQSTDRISATPAPGERPKVYDSNPNFAEGNFLHENTLNLSKFTSFTGGSESHRNMPPYLGINFIICLNGMYPPGQ